MMQALEQGWGSLRLAMQRWLSRTGWRRQRHASQTLARELGLPADGVHNILDHAVADLRELSDADGDPWPIIDRAVHEIDELGAHSHRSHSDRFQSDPSEDAIIAHYLRQLPERDRQILRHFNAGRKQSEIARLMGTDVHSVCNSLVSTYSGLRLRMLDAASDVPGDARCSAGVPLKARLRHRAI